ncbi:sensor histidine kinase, partial [Paenibacillus alvei TS-15]
MKKGIVFKLFVLTTALCLLILAIIYFGQTVFFKKYYIHQKVENVKASLDTFAQNYVNQVNDSLELWRLQKEAFVPFEGIVHNLERRYRETASEGIREYIE